MEEYVTHPRINKNTIERRKYQESIVASAVTGNTLAVLPTGLGKTSIAAMVSAHRLNNYKGKILFLAPTRPLVEQHRKSFEKFLKTEVEDFQVVTGEDSPENRGMLYKRGNIIFSTPQTVKNDLKKRVLDLKEFCLLIVDEAHRAVGNYAYPYVAKVYMIQAINPLILALTASPGAYRTKINEVKNKLYIKNVEIKSRDDEDVKPYIQEVKQYFEKVELTSRTGHEN
jgi:ERCC4-related helicase